MTDMDLRVHALGWALRYLPGASVAAMTPEEILRFQQRRIGHNALTDLLFGAVAPGVELADRSLPGPGGEVPVRVYTPRSGTPGSRPLVITYHGGGWTFGTLDQADSVCSHVAATIGSVVVSVDYRLAPAHRFPAAVEDCYAALVWAAEHAAELGADGSRIGVMGDSAGGNLAAVTCL